MRKATVALAKVTGQMEAILPEAEESSCDQGLLCHSRQDPVYVRVCLCIGYRDLTHETTGISLLAVPMKQCVSLTYGKPHQSQMAVHLYLGGIFFFFFALCICFTLLHSALYSPGCIL